MFEAERRDDSLLGKFREGLNFVAGGVRVAGLTEAQKEDLLKLIELMELMEQENTQRISDELLNQAEEVLKKYLYFVDEVKQQRSLDEQKEPWDFD